MPSSKRTKVSANAVETVIKATKSPTVTAGKLRFQACRTLCGSAVVVLGMVLSIACSIYCINGSFAFHILIVPTSHVRIQLPSDIVQRLQAGEILFFKNPSSNNTRQGEAEKKGETQSPMTSKPPMTKANSKRPDVRDQMRLHRQQLYYMEQVRSLSSDEVIQKLEAGEPLPLSNPSLTERRSQPRSFSQPKSFSYPHRF